MFVREFSITSWAENKLVSSVDNQDIYKMFLKLFVRNLKLE